MYRLSGKPSKIAVGVGGKLYATHRIIWEIFYGSIPDELIIDHIDRNPFNSVISNLRLRTKPENGMNMNMYRSNKSGFTGILYKETKKCENIVAQWSASGKKGTKYFNIRKLGLGKAFELAKETRASKILELNLLDAVYSDDHGLLKKDTY